MLLKTNISWSSNSSFCMNYIIYIILFILLDRGPKMETLPHPRDFMGPKWQDRVWSGDIKSGVCKMKCSALRFYAT